MMIDGGLLLFWSSILTYWRNVTQRVMINWTREHGSSGYICGIV
jgi:hypothetical protein